MFAISKSFLLIVLAAQVLSLHKAMASDVNILGNSRSAQYLLQQLKKRVLECVEANSDAVSEDGQRLGFRVKCADVKVTSAKQMFITYNKQSYAAILQDSAESDGGDLNDLYIYDSRSNLVATKYNVLAFNNIVLAITGSAHE